MKSIYVFCSRIWVYLTELPILILLAVAIAFNKDSAEPLKHYPLIIFLILAAAFVFLYFFRFISVNAAEIRYNGIFSSRDSASIKEKTTLHISLRKGRRMRIELFGDAGEEPIFDWMKAEDVIHREICMFRGKAVGAKGAAMRILNYFASEKASLDGCFNDGFFYEDDKIIISTTLTDEKSNIKIKFKVDIAPKNNE